MLKLFWFAAAAIGMWATWYVLSRPLRPTPLIQACAFGWDSQVARLLTEGADPNEVGLHVDEVPLPKGYKSAPFPDTPLSSAVRHACSRGYMAGYFYRIKGTEFEDSPEYRDVVVLLDHGANPSQACGDTSPLFTTSQYANPAVMQLLVKRGASLSARDSHGLTPLHAVGEYQAFPRWSKDAGTVALDTCIARCVHVLVRAGAAVEARDPLGRTPLHVAAMHGDIPMAEALIADGADIHAKDVGGMTPKDLASSVEMLELLTKAGG